MSKWKKFNDSVDLEQLRFKVKSATTYQQIEDKISKCESYYDLCDLADELGYLQGWAYHTAKKLGFDTPTPYGWAYDSDGFQGVGSSYLDGDAIWWRGGVTLDG